jgi:hypothetical protein
MKEGYFGQLAGGFLTLALILTSVTVPVASASPTLAAAGDVVITEIMQNPSAVGDSAGEWFELYNATGSPIDINGWTILDEGIDTHVIANGGPLEIPAGGFLVLGVNADTSTNGGVVVDYAYGSGWYLSNGDDEIVLLDESSTEIDRVAYDGGTAFPDPNGAAMALADPALDNTDGGNWCVATTPYGDGDAGTPGAENDCGTTPPPAPEVSIYDIQYTDSASGDSPYDNDTVTTEGIVTAVFSGGNQVWIQDGEGPWNGLNLYQPDPAPAVGDRVEVTGLIEEYYGLTQLTDGAVTVLSSGNPLPMPEPLPTGDVSQEQWESVLVRVDDVTVTDEDLGYGEWEVDDGTGPMVVDDLGSYSYTPANGDELDFVQGPLNYSFGAFKIEPRDDDDIGVDVPPPPVPEVNIHEIRIDQPGGDDDEYFELSGTPGASLAGLTYLVIGDGSGGSGVVENVTDLSGQGISTSGYFVAAEGSFNLGAADLTTSLNFENSDNVTHLLVSGFTGSYGDDLDTDDDGGLDAMPWGEIVDCVGLVETTAGGDQLYCDTQVGPDGFYVPAQVYLCDDGWRIGEYDTGITDSPGANNLCDAVLTGECGDPAILISAVQGDGFASPLAGTRVVIEGVVVGDFQDNAFPDGGNLSGFFVQEEQDDTDGNPLTSEGVFVYDGGFGVDVEEGDRVRINGVASEYFDLTEIVSLSDVLICDGGNSVAPTNVTLPESVDGELERYEGMLVRIANDMTVAQNYFLGRYGQMTLSSGGRMFQPTNQHVPYTPEAQALEDENARRLLILDDGIDVSSCGDNPDPVPYIGPPPPEVIRAGDTVENLVGVLDYGKINSGSPCYIASSFARDYRIHPTQEPLFTQANPRPEAPEEVGGEIKIASFNVLNYFTTLGSEGDVCGPTGGQECRGAYTASEFERQQTKIVQAMCTIDADIFGLMELENPNAANDPESGDGIDNYVLKSLVEALNDPISPCPDKTYGFTDSGAVGTDAIRQAIIYKSSTVIPLGRAVLDDEGFTDPNGLGEQKNRPAIAETFEDLKGARFTVVVNHLKSKGSPCGTEDDDPVQGNCNDTRADAAAYMIDWLETDPTGSGDPDFLVIGDLNAYALEDPIRAFLDQGFTDLVDAYQGETAYTYIFDGESGYLDHALANDTAAWQVTGATEWHINADEPAVIDYGEFFNPEGYYSPNAYRASDHDPVIVGLCDDVAPTLDVTVSPDTLWPPNHRYVTVVPTIDVSDNTDPNPTVTLVSVESNEPDNGRGDGNTTNDIVINPDGSIDLRAERSGRGDGRIYTITYRATDACGNSTLATATVTVPHDRGRGRGK